MSPAFQLSGVRELLKVYKVKALKDLSQNFLLEKSLLKRIVAKVSSPAHDNVAVLEIGPAAGNLTRALLSQGYSSILVIEKDPRFLPILKQLEEYSQGKIIARIGDALETQSNWFPAQWQDRKRLLIIGNLPYAVATPLALSFMKQFAAGQSGLFSPFKELEMCLLFQNEVAKKFSAKVGSRDYGRLAMISQAFCNVGYLQKIDRSSFVPAPKVDGGLVQFIFKEDMRHEHPSLFDRLEALSNQIFRHKNKKLTSLASSIPGLEPFSDLRPLHLSPDIFLGLARKELL